MVVVVVDEADGQGLTKFSLRCFVLQPSVEPATDQVELGFLWDPGLYADVSCRGSLRLERKSHPGHATALCDRHNLSEIMAGPELVHMIVAEAASRARGFVTQSMGGAQ